MPTNLILTPTQRRDLASLTPAARDADLRRLISHHEYAAWAKRLETEQNCFVPSGAAEARFSRRMEAEMPAMLDAVRGQLVRRELAA